MPDLYTLLAFLPAALALNLTPGADMAFAMAQGLRGGPRAAFAASAGISCGVMVHAALAGAGLAVLIAAFPLLFDAIRYAGAVWLLVLAMRLLRAGNAAELPQARPARAFLDGLMVNLSNPKVALFILAFVPQFVRPDAGPVLGQFLIFGAILSLGGFFITAGAGAFAARLGPRLIAGRALRWLSASIFSALALKLALGGPAHD